MTGTPTSADDTTAVFERYRRLLFSVCYDMLGSVADAEDCVQETWIRWARDDRSDVADPKSYLVRIATNVALNRLRSARNRRESYVGPWLPEPLLTSPDVADEVEVADSVSYAMLVVLETLNPVERAVFVLREVFGMPHAEIAESVGRSEAAVRQIAHRARDHVHARRRALRKRPTAATGEAGDTAARAAPDEAAPEGPSTTDRETWRRLTDRFLAACRTGDVDTLRELLAEDAVLLSDGGGKVRAALNPLYGADKCARFLAAVSVRHPVERLAYTDINGEPGVLLFDEDGSVSAGVLTIVDGRITEVLFVRNPDKLRHVRPSGGGVAHPGDHGT